LAQVRPAKGHLVPVVTPAPLPLSVRAPDFYLAPREGEIVLGSTMEFGAFDRRVERARVRALLEAAHRALPGLVRAREDAPAWAGVRPMSPDWAPLIGRSGPVLVSCGHSRNGWLLAPISAEIICAHVFEEDLPALWAAFHPGRFNER
jgi:glycine oxidase